MRPNWLRLIVVASWLFVDGEATAASPTAGKNEVQIKCYRRLASIPPGSTYACTVDVFIVTDRDRWLVLPSVMEGRLSPTHHIVSIEIDRKDDGLVVFSGVDSDDDFDAVLVPAHRRLHIKEWVIRTVENVADITVWVGDSLPLSNGESLAAIFKRLETRDPTFVSVMHGTWTAPKGTTVAFDPKGFKSIHLAPLPKRKK